MKGRAAPQCPVSGAAYEYYPRGNVRDIQNPQETVILRCPTEGNLAYLDGHVVRGRPEGGDQPGR